MITSHGLRSAVDSSVSAVTYVAAATTSNSTQTASLVINKPTGTVEGDIMVALYGSNSGVTWASASGWTEVIDQGAAPSLSVAYKVAGASEDANYTFTSSVSRFLSGAILTFRGAAYDVVGSVATNTTMTASAITLSSNSSAIIAGFFDNGTSRTWSNPTSGLISAATDSDANAPSFAIYYQLNVSSGSTGSKTATPSGTNNPASILVGLKPS